MRKVFIDTGGETCPKKKSKEIMAALIRSIRRAGLEGEVQVIARGCLGRTGSAD